MFLRRGAKMKSEGWIQPAGKVGALYAGNTPWIAVTAWPRTIDLKIDSCESRQ